MTSATEAEDDDWEVAYYLAEDDRGEGDHPPGTLHIMSVFGVRTLEEAVFEAHFSLTGTGGYRIVGAAMIPRVSR